MANKLREYLLEYYDENPLGSVRFVNKTCRLVRICKHQWKGQKKIKSGAVVVDGVEVSATSATNPSWKLIPNKIKAEFQAFSTAVDTVVKDMCISGRGDEGALVIGAGIYAIDINLWPECESMLNKIKSKWGASADAWCTDDGYKELHELLREQIGDFEYGRIKDLVPPKDQLRAAFWLEVTPLPWRLSEDTSEVGSETEARKNSTIDIIEATVREPREYAANTWTNLAAHMVEPGPKGVAAIRPIRRGKDGLDRPVSRSVRGESLGVARRGYEVLARANRFNDPRTIQALTSVAKEIPSNETDRSRIAISLNADDNEALRVGTVLLAAANTVLSEMNMIAGVTAAFARPTN